MQFSIQSVITDAYKPQGFHGWGAVLIKSDCQFSLCNHIVHVDILCRTSLLFFISTASVAFRFTKSLHRNRYVAHICNAQLGLII